MVVISTVKAWMYMWIKIKASWNKRFVEPNWFEPNKGFFKLRVVQITFYVVIVLSALVAYGISNTAPLIQCYTAACFNNTVTNYKVPLGILSVLIPLIAVFAANHRSEQTKHQLDLLREQNNFANYYKHLEEFENYLEFKGFVNKDDPKELNKSGFLIKDVRNLHQTVFSGARKGEYGVCECFESDVEEQLNNLLIALSALGGDGMEGVEYLEHYKDSFYNLIDIYEVLGGKLGITFPELEDMNNSFNIDGVYSLFTSEATSRYRSQTLNILNSFEVISSFDAEYSTSQTTNELYDFLEKDDFLEVHYLSCCVYS